MPQIMKGKKGAGRRRMAIDIPEELDRAVLDLRMTEEYCRCSYSEIVRTMMREGIKAMKNSHLSEGDDGHAAPTLN